MKFGRTYKMSIQGQHFSWTPSYPLTLEFDVQRNVFASANRGAFTLYNLQQAARRDIFFDRFVQNQRLQVVLQAGYQSMTPLPTIFKGDIRVAWSERRGVDWVTQIECFDGGFAFYNAFAGVTVPAPYTMMQAASALVAKMQPYGVTLGKVSNIKLPDQKTAFYAEGAAWKGLQQLVPGDGQLFVDLGICNILNPNDFLPTATGLVPEISAATGLLGTPRRYGNRTDVRMLFDPQYIVGQQANLVSAESWLSNPALKVQGIHHYGKISPVETGDLFTDLALFSGYAPQSLEPVDFAAEGQFA